MNMCENSGIIWSFDAL